MVKVNFTTVQRELSTMIDIRYILTHYNQNHNTKLWQMKNPFLNSIRTFGNMFTGNLGSNEYILKKIKVNYKKNLKIGI